MEDGLTSIQNQIIGKNKAAVEGLIGKPLKTDYWTNVQIPKDADEATINEIEATQLDEIWVYSNGRVHFNLAGNALEVDDNVSRYFPPEQPLIT